MMIEMVFCGGLIFDEHKHDDLCLLYRYNSIFILVTI